MPNYVPTTDLQAELPSVLRDSLDGSVVRRRLDEMEAFVFSVLGTPPPNEPMVKAIIRDLALSRFLMKVDSERASTLEENTLSWLDRYAKSSSFPGEGAASSGFYHGNIQSEEPWDADIDTITGQPRSPDTPTRVFLGG